MVALAYSDITTLTPNAPRAVPAAKRQDHHRPAGDPLVDGATRLLSIPLQQLYAFLWRTGLLVVDK